MAEEGLPRIQFKTPSFRPRDDIEAGGQANSVSNATQKPSTRRLSLLRQRHPKHGQLSSSQDPVALQDVYLGSYSRTSTPTASIAAPSPRASTFHLQLAPLLQVPDSDLETYGVEESRDGFFDASFFRPLRRDHDELMEKALEPLPDSIHKSHPLSLSTLMPQHFRGGEAFFRRNTTSRAGINLLKSFLGFFITYIICLIPASRNWLGRYNYILVISAIINHPGRPFGSQLDGALMTTLGTVAGLGWGSLALYSSTFTPAAQSGYGGILAAFLVIFAVVIGWLRCVLIRFYQAVIAAGFAIFYTCLANTSQNVGWMKVFDYGVPWVLGQAVCLVIAFVIFPDAGSRAISLALHDSLVTVRCGLALPHQDSPTLKRKLALQFVSVSQAVRDFTIDVTISRFSPDHIREVRNLLQGVIRSILSIRPNTTLFDIQARGDNLVESLQPRSNTQGEKLIQLISDSLREPTRELIEAMVDVVEHADLTIMEIGGQKVSTKTRGLSKAVDRLCSANQGFDAADVLLVSNPDLSSSYATSPEVMELFLFIHPVRQTADKVEVFALKILEMQHEDRRWQIRAPSHPFTKAIMRTNAQVRHDRGGLTAAFYFRGKRQLDRTMSELQSVAYAPAARQKSPDNDPSRHRPGTMGNPQHQEKSLRKTSKTTKRVNFRCWLWQVTHRLQGFETRFAFKVALVTTLVSIPAWLPQSRDWWNNNETWWAVVTVWSMMHPRVGGTFQDLAVRVSCTAIGTVWGGFAYAAGGGNPYVMAVFASLYMIPMLYRFTQSSHPRSGIIGCISFTVVSLSAYTSGGQPSIVKIAWTRGLAFVIGVVSAVIVNWLLWPFIARHELRKSVSAMMLHSAILYRGVVAKYIYYSEGEGPGPEDIARSEILEGRLREGFVRMRQLIELTRHEMRLRAPFDPLPYNALISACESFFEHIVQVRQSALYFQPYMLASDPEIVKSLTAPRRDAVAVILLNLYILACALRANRPVPRYLPSAAAARRKLLDRMEILETEQARKREAGVKSPIEWKGRRWADVYHYAYSGALTDIVENLQELQKYTKEVCGEVVWESDILTGK